MGRSRGINVYEEAWEELTREKAFEGYVPEKVCISLSQDGEAICQPTVLPGEYVSLGQVIGESDSGGAGLCSCEYFRICGGNHKLPESARGF